MQIDIDPKTGKRTIKLQKSEERSVVIAGEVLRFMSTHSEDAIVKGKAKTAADAVAAYLAK